ncbi:hypothetical protein J6590_077231 [Homalodisca vitripennis]|nr:hypothetical protein J6590_077231 [Homalodisca vitripennis]
MSKCALIAGRDIQSYETRGRDNYRTGRHRVVIYECLPSQAGSDLPIKDSGERGQLQRSALRDRWEVPGGMTPGIWWKTGSRKDNTHRGQVRSAKRIACK